MAGYEIYPNFPDPQHDPKKHVGGCERITLPEPVHQDPETSHYSLLYKLIDGRMEMVLVKQEDIKSHTE
jgi:hypothetical protein